MKICSKCGQEKNESEYYKKGNRLYAECKTCYNSRVSIWKNKNPEKQHEYMKRAAIKHKEKKKNTQEIKIEKTQKNINKMLKNGEKMLLKKLKSKLKKIEY